MIDEVAIETGRPRGSVLGPVLGITDDAACVREQPKESVSTTKVTIIEHVRQERNAYGDTLVSTVDAHNIYTRTLDLFPDVGNQVGTFEITATFTPEPPK